MAEGRYFGSLTARQPRASLDIPETPQPDDEQPQSRRTRYAYMRSDGTLDIVLGSLVAGLGAYVYQFLGGRSLGEEAFAPIGVLLTAHFLAFIIVLMPIEQFVIRRLTIGARVTEPDRLHRPES